MAEAPQTLPSSAPEFEKVLKLKDLEIASLKEKLALAETEVAEAQKIKANKGKQCEEVQALKTQSEGILTKAKAMIFENTKVIKNQELQIEALGQQNESLKDVVAITKDLLEIRNLEVKQLEVKITAMTGKVLAEKERQDLLHQKLETMIRHNGELKREYETQLCLFRALRERYNEKELAQGVVDDLRVDVTQAREEQSQRNQENVTINGEADPKVENAPVNGDVEANKVEAAQVNGEAAELSTTSNVEEQK